MPEWLRILRFLVAGLLNTGFGYVSYAAFVLTGAPIYVAVAGSTCLAILFNFYSYGGLVFGTTASKYIPRFLAFYGSLGLINYLLLRALTALAVGPLIAQALLLPLLMAMGYLGLRGFVFR